MNNIDCNAKCTSVSSSNQTLNNCPCGKTAEYDPGMADGGGPCWVQCTECSFTSHSNDWNKRASSEISGDAEIAHFGGLLGVCPPVPRTPLRYALASLLFLRDMALDFKNVQKATAEETARMFGRMRQLDDTIEMLQSLPQCKDMVHAPEEGYKRYTERESGGWQLIDSAPKDKEILISTKYGVYCARWYRNNWLPVAEDNYYSEWNDFKPGDVTHWMSMPESPEIEGGK